jgi:hypothetical protein
MPAGLPPDLPAEDSNPYAPPRTRAPLSRPLLTGVVPFDLGCIVRATWTLYKERFGACLAVCWTVLVLMWGSQLAQPRLAGALLPRAAGQADVFLTRFSLFFVTYVFNAWLSIGLNLALLEIARRRPRPFEQIHRGGRFVLTTLLAGVVFGGLLGAVVFVSLVPIPLFSAVFGRGGPGMVLLFAAGLLSAVCAATYLSARLSQFQLMIIDENAGVIDSLALSWQATRGRVGTLLVVFAFLALICLAGLLACLVGLLFTLPIAYLMLAVTYLSLTEQPIGRGKEGVESEDDEPDLPSFLA